MHIRSTHSPPMGSGVTGGGHIGAGCGDIRGHDPIDNGITSDPTDV